MTSNNNHNNNNNNKAPWTATPNINQHPKEIDTFHGDGKDPKVGWLGLDSKKLALPPSHSLEEPTSVTTHHEGAKAKLDWLGLDKKEINLPASRDLPVPNGSRLICQNCHSQYYAHANKDICTHCGSVAPLRHPSHPKGIAGEDGKHFENPWGPGNPTIPGRRWELKDRVKGSEKDSKKDRGKGSEKEGSEKGSEKDRGKGSEK